MAIVNGYCTLTDLKAILRIPASDTVDDAQLERVIESASRRIDGRCDRRFYRDATASARLYYTNDIGMLYIDDVATLDDFVVKIDSGTAGEYATTVVNNVDFVIEPLNALSKGEPIYRLRSTVRIWPSVTLLPGVQVTAKWGWPSVPPEITEATLLLAGRMFKRADSLLGVAGFSDLGAITVRGVDPDVDHLIQPFRRIGVN